MTDPRPSHQLAANRVAIEFLERHVAEAREMAADMRWDLERIDEDIGAMETALTALREQYPEPVSPTLTWLRGGKKEPSG